MEEEKENFLAIDFGTKRIGIAVYQEGRDPFPRIAPPLVIDENGTKKGETGPPRGRFNEEFAIYLAHKLIPIIKEDEISALIFGHPIASSIESKCIELFEAVSRELRKLGHHELKFFLQDERLSSYEAKDRMKNSPRFQFQVDANWLDSVAASVILEDFLSANRK